MKKFFYYLIVSVMIVWSLSFSTGAVDPAWYGFSYEYYIDRVVAVELIYYDNDDVGKVPSFSCDHAVLKPFDFSKMTVLETLTEGKIPEMLKDLSDVPTFTLDCNEDSPSGQGFRLILADGSFTVFTWGYKIKDGETIEYGYTGSYSADGVAEDWPTRIFVPSYFMVVAGNYFETEIKVY